MQVIKHIWDVSKYISFVFHQKSATTVVKPEPKEEDKDYSEEEEEDDDDDYCED